MLSTFHHSEHNLLHYGSVFTRMNISLGYSKVGMRSNGYCFLCVILANILKNFFWFQWSAVLDEEGKGRRRRKWRMKTRIIIIFLVLFIWTNITIWYGRSDKDAWNEYRLQLPHHSQRATREEFGGIDRNIYWYHRYEFLLHYPGPKLPIINKYPETNHNQPLERVYWLRWIEGIDYNIRYRVNNRKGNVVVFTLSSSSISGMDKSLRSISGISSSDSSCLLFWSVGISGMSSLAVTISN